MNGLKTVDAVTERNNLRIENERLRGDIERLNAENDRLVQERNESIRDHGHALNLWTEAKSQLAAAQESLSQAQRGSAGNEVGKLLSEQASSDWSRLQNWVKRPERGNMDITGGGLVEIVIRYAEALEVELKAQNAENNDLFRGINAARPVIAAVEKWEVANVELCDYLNGNKRDYQRGEGLRSKETLARIELTNAIQEYRKGMEAPQDPLMFERPGVVLEIVKACDILEQTQ